MRKISLSILPALLIIVANCSYSQVHITSKKQNTDLIFDTSKTAILEFKRPLPWIFDSTYKPAIITQKELMTIDSFVTIAVNDFNSWQKKNNTDNPWHIDYNKRNYKKQIVPVINSKGEKEIWINCFCSAGGSNWKLKPVMVEDGGTCYFNFKINLTKFIYYNFIVNSLG